MNFDFYFTTNTNIKSQMDHNLIVKGKILKLLEENTGIFIAFIALG